MQFTKEQFIEIFVQYNTTVFPAQIFIYILGLAAVYLSFKNSANSNKLISGHPDIILAVDRCCV